MPKEEKAESNNKIAHITKRRCQMKNLNKFYQERLIKNMFNKTIIKNNVKLLILWSTMLTILLLVSSGCSLKSTVQDSSETSEKTVTSIERVYWSTN